MINIRQTIFCLSTLFFLTAYNGITFAANNKPIQLNQNIDGNIERFEISNQSNYVVYNEFDNSGSLNRFSIKTDGSSRAIQIATDLSDREANFWIHEENFTVLSRNLDFDGIDTTVLSTPGDASSPPSFLSTFTPSSTELEDIGNLSIRNTDPNFLFSTRASGMYTIPVDGSRFATNLSPNLDPTFSIDRFEATRDRQNIIFSVDREEFDSQLVFIVPADGSNEPLLLAELLPFADMDNLRQTSLDDSRIIYISEISFFDDNNERQNEFQLFSLSLDGNSEPIPLSDPIISNSSDANQIDMSFQLSTDGLRIAYSTTNLVTNVSQLFITTIDGSTSPVLLDTAVEIFDFRLSTPQEQIFYSRRQEVDGNIDIASANISGDPNPVSISNAQIASDSLSFNNSVNTDVDFVLSEDGLSIFFITQDETGSHLFKSPSDGSCMRSQLSSNPLDSTGTTTVSGFQIINNDLTAVYSADLNITGINQLFSVSSNITNCITQNSTSVQEINNSTELSPLQVGNIMEFDTSDDENHIVFISQTPEQANQGLLSNLYSVSLIDEPLCFPIETKNGGFITICL